MKEYKTTIGLEIHAELKTKTKMFCDCINNPDEEKPNVNICPICMGHPGTLPVLNKAAIKNVLKIGLAVGGKIADFTEWDRKNYFYPDIPKGYQISQYKYPLVTGGQINSVDLTRIHLEEDTASSSHDAGEFSLVDFNRAGVPLMELVTEPVIHSAEEASAFAKELQLILRYLGIAEANMEKGEMRVEANISVSTDPKVFGTKVEVKNLNSFKAVEKAIAFEAKRHIDVLEDGGKIVQETRGWDETKQVTFSQRLKESSHDYRYFPDPDIPKLKISELPEFSVSELQKEIPELPKLKRERYANAFGLKGEDIEIYVNDRELGNYFEEVEKILGADKNLVKIASNYIVSDLVSLSRNPNFKRPLAKSFANLIKMIAGGDLSSRGAKDTLAIMVVSDGEPDMIAKDKGLIQKSDSEDILPVVQKIIVDNPKAIEDYKAGKESIVMFLVGQGMKAMKGAGNPEVLKKIILEELKK
ncbi:MAG: Asp-tRNA(Asn)/Glu-tRNA(Gln) amidotransferase subunit GatB [Minisyncoccia bacterium]